MKHKVGQSKWPWCGYITIDQIEYNIFNLYILWFPSTMLKNNEKQELKSS